VNCRNGILFWNHIAPRKGKALIPRCVLLGSVLFFAPLLAISQCPSGPENIHAETICGLSIGMKPDQVLALMKRPPDEGQEVQGDIVSLWKLPKGNILVVRFRKKLYVGALSLDFHPELMARDLELPSDYEEKSLSSSPAHTYDPKRKFEYQRNETQNAETLVWYREEKDPRGYTYEVGFQSASRLKLGERFYKNVVVSKFITVRKAYLEKLDKAMSPPGPNSPDATTAPPANPGGNRF
jgi:hypothetical protein